MKNLNTGNLTGDWKDGNNTVKMNLPIMIFQEDETKIAYIPVLDLSGYGKTDKEAIESLHIVLSEYFLYSVRKKTLIADLKAHGWTIKKKTKPYIAPEITDLINKNEYLHDIVNSRPYKMKRIDVDMPQYA
jgi:hypothetical protein